MCLIICGLGLIPVSHYAGSIRIYRCFQSRIPPYQNMVHVVSVGFLCNYFYVYITVCSKSGKYGMNCSKSCDKRHCANRQTCHHASGLCLDKCQDGWTGLECDRRKSV